MTTWSPAKDAVLAGLRLLCVASRRRRKIVAIEVRTAMHNGAKYLHV